MAGARRLSAARDPGGGGAPRRRRRARPRRPRPAGHVEIGITLAPAAQGAGIATEALAAVLDACFAQGTHRVFAVCDARNAPVARLLARLGLRHEARLVDAERWKGEWTTADTWAVLAAERRS